jgi:hypothetical protein
LKARLKPPFAARFGCGHSACIRLWNGTNKIDHRLGTGSAEVFEQRMTEDNLELNMNVMDQASDFIPPKKTRDCRMIAS